MFMPHTTVDQLLSVRQRITELRIQELSLEKRLYSAQSNCPIKGLTSDAYIDVTAHKVFDLTKLPDSILEDPRHYALRHVRSIRFEPHEAATKSQALLKV